MKASKNQEEIKISPATPEDAEGIQKVFYHTWIATYPNKEFNITVEDLEYRHRNMFIEENLEERRKMIREIDDSKKRFLVAKIDDKIVGVCNLHKDAEKNKMQAIYVLPEYQGRGIGKKFWQEALKYFDTSKDTYVDVVVYNTNAIKFYENLGFVDTGKRFSEERFRQRNGALMPEMEMVLKAKL